MAANRQRGEVEFEAGGQTYVARIDWNAIALAEEAARCSYLDILDAFSSAPGEPLRVSIRIVRALLWAGLQRSHPRVSLDDAGDLIGALGPLRAVDVVLGALSAVLPVPEDGDPPADPPTPAA